MSVQQNGESPYVMVFRTNLQTLDQKNLLLQNISGLQEVEDASLDLEDCDRVLRIVSQRLKMDTIIEIVNQHGFACEELT